VRLPNARGHDLKPRTDPSASKTKTSQCAGQTGWTPMRSSSFRWRRPRAVCSTDWSTPSSTRWAHWVKATSSTQMSNWAASGISKRTRYKVEGSRAALARTGSARAAVGNDRIGQASRSAAPLPGTSRWGRTEPLSHPGAMGVHSRKAPEMPLIRAAPLPVDRCGTLKVSCGHYWSWRRARS
jgi:hypothetical protein